MTDLIVQGADFSANAVGYAPPVASGLEYLNFFNSESQIGRNLAPGKASGAVVGSPVQNVEFVTFSNLTNYVQTDVDQTDDMTVILAMGVPVEGLVFALGNYSNAEVSGLWVWTSNFTGGDGLVQPTMSHAFDVGSPTVQNATSGAELTVPFGLRLFLGTYELATRTAIFKDLTGNTSQTRNPAEDVIISSRKFRIGSASASTTAGPLVNIGFAAVWSRVLSAAEQTTMTTAVRSYYAARGITV